MEQCRLMYLTTRRGYASKAYGLAGLRLGYGISSAAIADILNRARLPFNVNMMAVKVGCAALADKNHLVETKTSNVIGMKQIKEGLSNLNLNYIPSVANFISFEVIDADKIYVELLKKGIIVRPLTPYHLPYHIRVTIGTESQNERFLKTLSNLKSEKNE